jgi:hypothetical protein
MLPRWRIDGLIVVAAFAPVVGIFLAIHLKRAGPGWFYVSF